MVVKFIPNDTAPGKLADAELHFTEGVLEGLKLVGFAVWERRSGNGRNVTFPSRQYTVQGAPKLRIASSDRQFGEILKQVHIPSELAGKLAAVLRESQADREQFTRTSLLRLQQQQMLLRSKLDRVYEDRLNDDIPEELWTTKSAALQEELRRVRTEMERHEVAGQAYEAAGLQILELAQSAYSSYVTRNPRDQARLIKTVVSNSTFDRGTLCPTYVKPFDVFAQGTNRRLAPRAGFEPATLRLTAGTNGVSRPLRDVAASCQIERRARRDRATSDLRLVPAFAGLCRALRSPKGKKRATSKLTEDSTDVSTALIDRAPSGDRRFLRPTHALQPCSVDHSAASERDLQTELNVPLAALVADASEVGACGIDEASVVSVGGAGPAEIRVIREVEELRPELDLARSLQRECLDERDVPALEPRPADGPPTCRPNAPRVGSRKAAGLNQ
jgi:hypothetical protein